jgi:hypothetical protein
MRGNYHSKGYLASICPVLRHVALFLQITLQRSALYSAAKNGDAFDVISSD